MAIPDRLSWAMKKILESIKVFTDHYVAYMLAEASFSNKKTLWLYAWLTT